MKKQYLACASIAALLAGCGGGGGSIGASPQTFSPPPPPEPVTIPKPVTVPTAEDFDTPEYEDSTSAKNSGVLPAWQDGATGKGIKIGFIDSGIAINSPEFAGRIDPASRDFENTGTIDDEYGHGTALASVAAARHGDGNPDNVEGIAYEATIVMMKVAPAGCVHGCGYDVNGIAHGITAAVSAGAKVINLSFSDGVSGTLTSGMRDAIQSAAKTGVIFTISAGNDSAAQPSMYAQQLTELAPGQVIIAGALGVQDGSGTFNPTTGAGIDYNQMLGISDKAGSFSAYYLGAPGYNIRVAYRTAPNSYDIVTGTSFAAPAVAGAVALMLQAFPSLTPKEVVQILLMTADDLGAPGADPIYGSGRLDIGRAFQPIGQTTMAGQSLAVSLVNNGSAPAASGDAVQRRTLKAVVLDAFSRAFTINLARTLHSAGPSKPLTNSVLGNVQDAGLSFGPAAMNVAFSDQSVGRKLGFQQRGVGPESQLATLQSAMFIGRVGRTSAAASLSRGSWSLLHTLSGKRNDGFVINDEEISKTGFSRRGIQSLAFRQTLGPVGLSASQESGRVAKSYASDDVARYKLYSLVLDGKFRRFSAIAGVSRLDEGKTVLGGRLIGPFGDTGSKTLFLDAELGAQVGRGWSISADARRGWTRFAAGALRTDAYSLKVTKDRVLGSDDLLSLSFLQPLRVESGGFSMRLPGSYDYQTLSPEIGPEEMSLRPSGREITGEIGYSRQLHYGFAGIALYARRQPGHVASAAADLGGAVQWRMKL